MTPPDPVSWLRPEWPAPANVRALTTLRAGGVSRGAYASLNLAGHVGDDPACVEENRRRLARAAVLPAEACWLRQVHGTTAIDAAAWRPETEADAIHCDRAGRVLAVLTADCLPVLLCDRDGGWIAAVHAGWRGLAMGVIASALAGFAGRRERLIAWLGPAIGPAAFEVGEEVRERFVAALPRAAACFAAGRGGRWMADLYGLASLALCAEGVAQIHGGGWCTFGDAARFYSYRRDGHTGRMATLAWLV
jgi:YfiH family protein